MPTNTFQERVNYIRNECGTYTGYCVNLPVVVGQAHDMDELKYNMKETVRVYLQHMLDLLDQPEPFEMKELTKEEWFSQDNTLKK